MSTKSSNGLFRRVLNNLIEARSREARVQAQSYIARYEEILQSSRSR